MKPWCGRRRLRVAARRPSTSWTAAVAELEVSEWPAGAARGQRQGPARRQAHATVVREVRGTSESHASDPERHILTLIRIADAVWHLRSTRTTELWWNGQRWVPVTCGRADPAASGRPAPAAARRRGDAAILWVGLIALALLLLLAAGAACELITQNPAERRAARRPPQARCRPGAVRVRAPPAHGRRTIATR